MPNFQILFIFLHVYLNKQEMLVDDVILKNWG